jgi:hypothetical protein
MMLARAIRTALPKTAVISLAQRSLASTVASEEHRLTRSGDAATLTPGKLLQPV